MENVAENVVEKRGGKRGANRCRKRCGKFMENYLAQVKRNTHDHFHKCFTAFYKVVENARRRGGEQPGRTNAPASPGPSREIPGRIAHPPSASTTTLFSGDTRA